MMSASDSGTALVVDDDYQIRRLVRTVLSHAGFTVSEARNGQEALDRGRDYNEPIDLLVTDVVLPGWIGPEVAHHLAQMHPEMHVLFMSGFAREELTALGVNRPGVTLLTKPFTPDSLLKQVDVAIHSERLACTILPVRSGARRAPKSNRSLW